MHNDSECQALKEWANEEFMNRNIEKAMRIIQVRDRLKNRRFECENKAYMKQKKGVGRNG